MAAGRIHNFAFFLLTFYFLKLINQFESIMQNKPNLLNTQMNVNTVITKDYENVRLSRRRENKPNQTQFFKIPDNLGSRFSISNWISSTSALIVAALYYYRTKTRYIKPSFCVKARLPAQIHRFF